MKALLEVVYWAGLVGSLAFLAYLLSRRFGAWFGQLRRTTDASWRPLAAPSLLLVLAGAAYLSRPGPGEIEVPRSGAELLLLVLVGLAATWLVARVLRVAVEAMLARHDVTTADNLSARTVHTQYRVLLRIGTVLVWTVGSAIVLWNFPGVRALGSGLLASAGIAGLVLGLAAQRTIGNFLAGIQIALTQPIRLDDAVVVDDEWGWIEDITTTYVVVRIWDERRLIVPFTRILEASFQNWTRTRADLIGSVMLWTDHRVDVAAMRKELNRIVESSDLWDGRVAVLQVVDTNERAVQLRALVSSATSPRAWDLRCHVRERLLEHLVRDQPHALPRVRGEIESTRRASAATDVRTALPPDAAAEIGGLPGAPETKE